MLCGDPIILANSLIGKLKTLCELLVFLVGKSSCSTVDCVKEYVRELGGSVVCAFSKSVSQSHTITFRVLPTPANEPEPVPQATSEILQLDRDVKARSLMGKKQKSGLVLAKPLLS